MKRREFMLAASGVAGGTAATAGAAGSAVAAEEEEDDHGDDGGDGGGGEPDYGGWLSDANEYDGTEDLRGEDEVQVDVGAGPNGFAFDPAAIWIDPGTTVVWEWTGEGGAHNVNAQEGEDFESEIVADAGHTFEHTFEEDGVISTYQCDPHAGEGMKGAVAVGDVETVSAGEGGPVDPHELGVDIHEHWVGVGVVLMLVVSLVFTFFVLKYGESPHASGRNG